MTLQKNFMILTLLKSGELTRVDFETIEAARQVFKMKPLPTVLYSELIDIRTSEDIVLDTFDVAAEPSLATLRNIAW